MTTDRRLTPARPDLAARHLAGRVEAARFADPAPHRVAAAVAPLRPAPDEGAVLDTELLHGEEFAVYDKTGGWAWGQGALDGYVGFVPAAALTPAGSPAPGHRVRTQWATLYARPVLKSPPAGALPFGARVAVHDAGGGFARIGPDCWVHERQVAALAAPEPDWVAVAERFLGTPYVWGGRSPAGIDCSGLVQVARQAAGHACPRDSDMQAAGEGRTLAEGEPLRRGDLVFWRGHVAIMIDEIRIVHATGHFMETVIEPLAIATAWIQRLGAGPVTRRARLDGGAGPV
jgi:hypothetical protein